MDKYGDLSFLFGSCFHVIIGFVLFVLFVFSPVFFIFGFDYSFVRNSNQHALHLVCMTRMTSGMPAWKKQLACEQVRNCGLCL